MASTSISTPIFAETINYLILAYQSRVVLNAIIHAVFSLTLYKISVLLLRTGSHRNYSSTLASTASFCGVLFYAVHPNRLVDSILYKSPTASTSSFCMLVALYVFLLRRYNNRAVPLRDLSLSSPRAYETLSSRASFLIGFSFSILAIVIVVVFTYATPLIACTTLLAAIMFSVALSKSGHKIIHQRVVSRRTWTNSGLFLLLLSVSILCALINTNPNTEAVLCRNGSREVVKVSFTGMLVAEVLTFWLHLLSEAAKPLMIHSYFSNARIDPFLVTFLNRSVSLFAELFC